VTTIALPGQAGMSIVIHFMVMILKGGDVESARKKLKQNLMKIKDNKMTEAEKKEKNDILLDILELNDDAQNILEALIEIATLDQFYELYNSFYEPPEERSDWDEHNTMSSVYHTPYSI